jgi:hypothetical protein
VRHAMGRIESLRTALFPALPRRANRRFGTAIALPIVRAGEEVYNLLLCSANEGVRELASVGLRGRLSAMRLRTLMEEDCYIDWAAADDYLRAPIALRRLDDHNDVWTPTTPPNPPSPAPPSAEESFEIKVEVKQEDGSVTSTREMVPYTAIAVKE